MELVTEKSQSKVDEYCIVLRGELNKLEIHLIPNKKVQSVDYRFETIYSVFYCWFKIILTVCYNSTRNNVFDRKLENRILFLRVVSSDFEYIQDVPAILTFDRRFLQKNETGELIQNEKEPQWSLVLNCNKQTVLNYGPYFDRQREALWNFFFPQTYAMLEPQPEPTLNERRQTSKFDLTINLKDANTEINILFAALSNTNPMPANRKKDLKNKTFPDTIPNERKLVNLRNQN